MPIYTHTGAPSNGLNACPAQAGSFCPANDNDDIPDSCPQGYYCDGGSAQPKTCSCPAGRFCDSGSSTPVGALCPILYYCTGGTDDKLPCPATAGSYCPAGTLRTLTVCVSNNNIPQTAISFSYNNLWTHDVNVYRSFEWRRGSVSCRLLVCRYSMCDKFCTRQRFLF